MNELQTRILNVITSIVKTKPENPESLVDGHLMDKLGVSSIDALEILLAIEREFSITIEDEDLNQELLSSLKSIEAYVLKSTCAESA